MGDEHAVKHVHYANVTVKVRVTVTQEMIPTRRPQRALEDDL